MNRPLVTCIMPTRDRPAFVGQAVAYFLRQDYPARELVIVDDGAVSIGNAVPADPRIRYVRLDHRHPVGAKRNLACQAGRGELIAHWDDDDWMRADRLSRQVAAFAGAPADHIDACGLGELHYLRPIAGDAWRYRPLPQDPPWLAGPTLMYRRETWRDNPFPDVDIGEDTAFVRRLPAHRLRVMADPDWYVGLLHPGNTGPKYLRDPRWEPADLATLLALIGPDQAFYASVRSGRSTPGHGPGRAPATPGTAITVAADFFVYDGYAGMAEYLALGIARAGARVNLAPITLDERGLSPDLRALLAASRSDLPGPVLYSSYLRPELDRYAGRELFVHTMWESSRLPATWPARLNQARAVIVPTRFVADVCRCSGVDVPVAVVPDGVDPAVYPYLPRPARPGVTTLIVGTPIARKHLPAAVAAWRLAFPRDPDARLVVKSRFGLDVTVSPGDDRIRVVTDNEAGRGIAHRYRDADVLLALGNEGFGLPLVEAMATGLPVIALDAEGQSDICRQAPDAVLAVAPAGVEACRESGYGDCGVRAVPDVDAVADRLRWVATHRDEAVALGREASAWAHRHRDVWRKGPAVLSVMERHGRTRRPLRRRRAVWVPSWGRPCGVAEHAAAVLRCLPRAPRLYPTASAPDPARISLLHVEHEDALFTDVELAEHARRARDAGVPVVVTEHSVRDGGRAFEATADALVSLTAAGADILRARWPGTPVVRVPHGCPTWFPPRKRRRGTVLGAFGFLAPHKGFTHLLDVLRTVPGTELLLVSYPTDEAQARAWAAASAGLPVRWERRYLPAETIARRLAAEADVLVFWYDEVSHASASGAARIGLATGVPVLASPTRWFADLAEVTYQPADLAEGVARLLADTALRDRLVGSAREFCHQHTWRRVADEYARVWEAVER